MLSQTTLRSLSPAGPVRRALSTQVDRCHSEGPADKRHKWHSLPFTGDETLISFCNTGHWAATNWFALSELAGLDDVKLYPESMVGWSAAGLPMQNTPGVFQNLLNQITGAL